MRPSRIGDPLEIICAYPANPQYQVAIELKAEITADFVDGHHNGR